MTRQIRMLNSALRFCVLVVLSCLCWQPASAQVDPGPAAESVEGQEPVSTWEAPQDLSVAVDSNDDFWTRPTLTGNWFGLRPSLQESGVTFVGKLTQFGFGIAGGINKPTLPILGQGDSSAYTGRGQYAAILDLDKLVGLPKGKFLIQFENWFGQFGNVSLGAGTFAPPVFPALLPPAPNDPGSLFLTNFVWTQPLSERLVVFAGKRRLVGTTDQDIFAGGDGTDQFVNQALIANPAFLLGLPFTSFGAGFVSPQKWGSFSGFVHDPTDRTTDYFQLNNMFSQGVIIAGEVRLKTNFFNLPGEQHVGGVWKHVPQTNLAFQEPPPGVYPEPTVPGFPTLDNMYTIYYGFDQYLVRFPDSDRGWGVFGHAAITDGNPNPVKYFLSTGLGGYSPFGKQRGDTFGIAWYLTGASTAFGPLPTALFGPRNGTGVELYYNFQLTPWLNLTPDIQFIRPGTGAIATNSAFVYGIRLNTRF
jgi:porin